MALKIEDPTALKDVNQLPDDAVSLLVWRDGFGPQPLTIIISKASWDMNRERVGMAERFKPDSIYEFESPTNEQGRKSIFHLQKVIGWCANVHSGIISVKKPKLMVPA